MAAETAAEAMEPDEEAIALYGDGLAKMAGSSRASGGGSAPSSSEHAAAACSPRSVTSFIGENKCIQL